MTPVAFDDPGFWRRRLLDTCESPIERLLGAALFDAGLCPMPQRDVGPFRLDFAITMFEVEHGLKLGIECDGHDFHERTKEQAARARSRDRFLASKGWTVLRFTGSEIHRDTARCLADIRRVISHHAGPLPASHRHQGMF